MAAPWERLCFFGDFGFRNDGFCLVGVDVSHQLLAGDGFLHQQVFGDLIQQAAVIRQQLHSVRQRVVQQLLHSGIHLGGSLLGAVHVGLALQILMLDRCGGHETQFVGHTVEGDHVLGQRGGLLNVVGSAVGHGAKGDHFRGPAAQQTLQLYDQLISGGQELFFLGHIHGVAQGTGGFPPYMRDQKLKMLGNHHVILSHFRAVRAYREMGFKGQIGIVHAITPVYPADQSNPYDIAAAYRAVMNRFEIYMSPMVEGRYPNRLLLEAPRVLASMPDHFQEDIDKWFAPMDFVGINYYNSGRSQFMPDTTLQAKGVENFYTAPGQRFVAYPAGLLDVLTYVWQRYQIPIYISENGMGVETNNIEEEDCNDDFRIEYLREHLRMVSRALKLGVGVKGYFYWNDADSYESQSGYRYRFGLTWVDRATGRRRWKASRHYFSKVCKSRMVD